MKKLFAVILAFGMLFLSACSEIPAIEAQEFGEKSSVSQTEPKSDLDTEKAPEGPAESIITPDPEVSEAEKTPEPAEEDNAGHVPEAAPSQTAAPETTLPQSEPQQEQQVKVPISFEIIDDKSEVTPEPDPGSNVSEPEPEPVVTPTPEPDPDDSDEEEPAELPAVEPTPDPVPEPTPEPEPTLEPEPAFDISYWVSFAKSYGQQVGLSYDAQATSCWDNPIIASAKSIYLERDITSRLSRYVREGMTAFCVWSEPLADGRYNIYIGYA